MSRHKGSAILGASVARVFQLPVEPEAKKEAISCYTNLLSPICTAYANSDELQPLLQNTEHKTTVFLT